MTEDHKSRALSIAAERPLTECRYTEKQGQYLTFIYYYTKLNGYPPAETDLMRFFRVSSASVHRMVVELDKRGLLRRTPGMPRSMVVTLPREQLPELW